ncbi:hypothetical protein V8E54_006796 [Elaphomyces granulatus]
MGRAFFSVDATTTQAGGEIVFDGRLARSGSPSAPGSVGSCNVDDLPSLPRQRPVERYPTMGEIFPVRIGTPKEAQELIDGLGVVRKPAEQAQWALVGAQNDLFGRYTREN